MITLVSTFSEGLLISLFSILIIFAILGFVALTVQSLKYLHKETKKVITVIKESVSKPFQLSDIKDEDMMVAALVASIDYYDEIKQDVRVVSVKEITNQRKD